MASLAVRSLVRRSPRGDAALNGVNLELDDGRIGALLGPPGAGKSALLRVIAGLDEPERGDVLLDGISVLNRPSHQRRIGLVFQDLALFESQTARANVAFGMRSRGWADDRSAQQADELLAHIGLTDVADRPVAELSPEARGRVALARALAPRPELLLLDEPAATLGEQQRALWRELLGDLLRDFGVTALVATQDVREAATYADTLAVFARGRVLQAGRTAHVLAGPVSVEVAELLGWVRLIEGSWRDGFLRESGIGLLEAADLHPIEPTAIAMAHPSSMFAIPADTATGGSGLTGAVERCLPEGPGWSVRLRLGSGHARVVPARWEWDLAPPTPGARLALMLVPGTVRFFTSNGVAIGARPAAPSTPATEPDAPLEEPANGTAPTDAGANGNGHAARVWPEARMPIEPTEERAAAARHQQLPPVD